MLLNYFCSPGIALLIYLIINKVLCIVMFVLGMILVWTDESLSFLHSLCYSRAITPLHTQDDEWLPNYFSLWHIYIYMYILEIIQHSWYAYKKRKLLQNNLFSRVNEMDVLVYTNIIIQLKWHYIVDKHTLINPKTVLFLHYHKTQN